MREANPGTQYFFYRHDGNHECGTCPSSYQGTTKDTTYEWGRVSVYRITNWVKPAAATDMLVLVNPTLSSEFSPFNCDGCYPAENVLDGRAHTYASTKGEKN